LRFAPIAAPIAAAGADILDPAFAHRPAIVHHLQLHLPISSLRAGWKCESIGQCSRGDLAFASVGQPQPSMAESRSIFWSNGGPQ
jgi:hypothetical protein